MTRVVGERLELPLQTVEIELADSPFAGCVGVSIVENSQIGSKK